ncbi:MAG: FAD-dependent oxidoreductase [Sedimentitalea sp.]|uniref:FAD-dependent oxidoreductase n=1 Tax=Sedimentitalea sp. TaxID=2048915 RepID=UPI00326577A8
MINETDFDVDYLIIGGGFYGCCLGLFLRSISDKVAIVETADRIMERASRVNQARVHSGFHYPRSVLTAVKSQTLHRRFADDFPDAVKTDFRMLYAIARNHSKVSALRFERMFRDMGASIQAASAAQSTLFDPDLIDSVFDCTEYAFDFSILRDGLMARIDALGMELMLNTEVQNVTEENGGVTVTLSSGREVRARYVFNVTYAHINEILRMADLPPAKLKFELTEIALIQPPEELTGAAVTVMDGPFFSAMPYPAEDLYSLTHVRYTPHLSWNSTQTQNAPYDIARGYSNTSRARYMIQDAKRFMPCLSEAKVKTSLFDVKAVLIKNEDDDGRPILFQRRPDSSHVISILGGKIDNIYDLFELVRTIDPAMSQADDRYVLQRAGR